MAKAKVIYEDEKQYNRRIEAECQSQIDKETATEWFLYAQRFFQRKVDTAKDHGEVALAKFWFEEGNKFFGDYLSYVSLGYKEAVKNPEKYLLPVDKSRAKTASALARSRKYKKKLEEMKKGV